MHTHTLEAKPAAQAFRKLAKVPAYTDSAVHRDIARPACPVPIVRTGCGATHLFALRAISVHIPGVLGAKASRMRVIVLCRHGTYFNMARRVLPRGSWSRFSPPGAQHRAHLTRHGPIRARLVGRHSADYGFRPRWGAIRQRMRVVASEVSKAKRLPSIAPVARLLRMPAQPHGRRNVFRHQFDAGQPCAPAMGPPGAGRHSWWGRPCRISDLAESATQAWPSQARHWSPRTQLWPTRSQTCRTLGGTFGHVLAKVRASGTKFRPTPSIRREFRSEFRRDPCSRLRDSPKQKALNGPRGQMGEADRGTLVLWVGCISLRVGLRVRCVCCPQHSRRRARTLRLEVWLGGLANPRATQSACVRPERRANPLLRPSWPQFLDRPSKA